MAESSFTFLDGGAVSRTHRSQETSSVHTPATILYGTGDDPLLGQGTMAASLPVAIASNQTAIPVTLSEPISVDDNGGSLTVDDGGSSLTTDTTQLPSTLGAKTGANSLSVVTASDDPSLTYLDSIADQLLTGSLATIEKRFTTKGRYNATLVDVSGPNGDVLVSTTTPPTYAGAVAPTTAFFAGAGVDANPRYVYIPIQGGTSGVNYDRVSLTVRCTLTSGIGVAIDCVVRLYSVQDTGTVEVPIPLDTVTLNNDTLRATMFSIGAAGSAISGGLLTGAGSPTYRALAALQGPHEMLLLEFDPAINPDLGSLEVVVIREKG